MEHRPPLAPHATGPAAPSHRAPWPGRGLLWAARAAWAAACSAQSKDTADPLADLQLVTEDPSDSPIAGLDARWSERFAAGDAVFEHSYRPAEGLGPLYIRASCAGCHAADSKGPGGVQKFVVLDEEGLPVDDPSALPYGDTERPYTTAGATTPVLAPEHPEAVGGAAVQTSLRLGPAVFGRGYLEAIDEDAILALERAQISGEGGVRGRAAWVCRGSAANPDQPFHDERGGACGLLGRFGLKATLASLDDFTAKAFLGDMGLSSPLRPHELPNPDGLLDDERLGVDLDADELNLAADYVRLLALPERSPARFDGAPLPDGPARFAALGCDRCHRPSLPTRADYPVPELAGIDAPVFTDLLLHDMGEGLADGLAEGAAGGRDWRTAPLIGLRFFGRYLHDGRAEDLAEAIALHASPGSEANRSVAAFQALSAADQARLIAYLETL